jgi:hypothetical protein
VSAELTRWPEDAPPTRSRLEAIFYREKLSPNWWSNGPHHRYSPHSHSYHKVLYCSDGSMTFCIEPDGLHIELHAGDRLDILPGTSHSAIVGPDGVTCVEASRQSG